MDVYSEGNIFLPILTSLVLRSTKTLPEIRLDELFPNNPLIGSFCEQVLNYNPWINKKTNTVFELPVPELDFVRLINPPVQHIGYLNFEKLFAGDVNQKEHLSKILQQSRDGWKLPASFDPKFKHYLDGMILLPLLCYLTSEQSLTPQHFKKIKPLSVSIQKTTEGKNNLLVVLSSSNYEIFKATEMILKWFADTLQFVILDRRITQRPFVYSIELTPKGTEIFSDVLTSATNLSISPFTKHIKQILLGATDVVTSLAPLDDTLHHNVLYCYFWKFVPTLRASIQAAMSQKTDCIVVFNSVVAEAVSSAIGTQADRPKIVLVLKHASDYVKQRMEQVGVACTTIYTKDLSPEQCAAAVSSQTKAEKILFLATFMDSLLPQPSQISNASMPPKQMLTEGFQQWHRALYNTPHRLMFLAMHGLQESAEIKESKDTLRLQLTFMKTLCHDPTPLIPASEFLMCAAQTGLFPSLETTRRLPGDNYLTAFSIHCFSAQNFQVRCSLESDMEILLDIESKCWSERLRSSRDELSRRLREYPEGQIALIRERRLIGCMYSQRVPTLEDLKVTTFRECGKFLNRSGTAMQFLGINILPEFQWLGLGDDLMEFMQHLSASRCGIRHTGAITRCAKYASQKNNMKIEDYIHSKGPDGLPVDPILKFHASHGATVVGPVPGFRPEDSDNQGVGVLVKYDVLTRVRKSEKSFSEESSASTNQGAGQVSTPTTPTTPTPAPERQMTAQEIRTFVKETTKKLLAKDDVSETRSLMEMGLDSLAIQEFREILESTLAIAVPATAFFDHYNLQLLSDFLVNQYQQKFAPKIVEGPAAPPSEFQVLIMSGSNSDSEKAIISRTEQEFSKAADWKQFCRDCMLKPHGPQRYAIIGDSRMDILRSFSGAQSRLFKFENMIIPTPPPVHKFAYVFGSLGTEFLNMAKDLFESSSVFRNTMQDLDSKLKPFLSGQSIIDIIYPPATSTHDQKAHEELLHKYAYPALFVFEYSVATLWSKMGAQPQLLMGHSWGEFIAACFAGVIRLDDGLRIAAMAVRWSTLILERSGALIVLDEVSVRAIISSTKKHSVCIVAVNNGDQVMIAGPDADVQEVLNAIESRYGAKVLPYPDFPVFHTPSVDLFFEELESVFDGLKYSAPSIPIISCINGKLMKDASVIGTSKYWKRMFSTTVYFVHSITTLIEQDVGILVNTSPNRNIMAAIQHYTVKQSTRQFLLLSSMKTLTDPSRKVTVFSVGQLFMAGYDMTKIKYECLD